MGSSLSSKLPIPPCSHLLGAHSTEYILIAAVMPMILTRQMEQAALALHMMRGEVVFRDESESMSQSR